MEHVNCYNCGSDRHAFYLSENGFTLVKCSECGLLYVTPRPTAEEIKVGHKYGVHIGDNKLEATGRFTPSKCNNYFDILEEFFGDKLILGPKRTWLDIGCGHGEFILALQNFSRNNVIAKGIEPNIHKQMSAQKRGLDVSYFDLDRHSTQYDCISLLNVYSHLPNPKAALTNWKRLLKSGGEMLLETGDVADFDRKDMYSPLHLPDHLSFASESIVTNILDGIGYRIIKIVKYPVIKLNIIGVAKEIIKIFWPNDFETPFELQAELDDWVMNYNTDYPHSSLNYKTPCEFEGLYYEKLSNFLVA